MQVAVGGWNKHLTFLTGICHNSCITCCYTSFLFFVSVIILKQLQHCCFRIPEIKVLQNSFTQLLATKHWRNINGVVEVLLFESLNIKVVAFLFDMKLSKAISGISLSLPIVQIFARHAAFLFHTAHGCQLFIVCAQPVQKCLAEVLFLFVLTLTRVHCRADQ